MFRCRCGAETHDYNAFVSHKERCNGVRDSSLVLDPRSMDIVEAVDVPVDIYTHGMPVRTTNNWTITNYMISPITSRDVDA